MNEPEQIFNASFFIRYFSNIPDDQWCTGLYNDPDGNHCALGHCGVQTDCEGLPRLGTMATKLYDLFRAYLPETGVIEVNDYHYLNQPTPRARILAALHFIQSKQTPPKPAPPAPPLQITSGWPSVTMAQPATVREVV